MTYIYVYDNWHLNEGKEPKWRLNEKFIDFLLKFFKKKTWHYRSMMPECLFIASRRRWVLGSEKDILSAIKKLSFYKRPLEGQEMTCPKADRCIGRYRSMVVYTTHMHLSVTGVSRRQFCAYGSYGLESEGEKQWGCKQSWEQQFRSQWINWPEDKTGACLQSLQPAGSRARRSDASGSLRRCRVDSGTYGISFCRC